MTSVWLTAKNSFIARNLIEQLPYDFTATTHTELDLTSEVEVNDFLKGKFFDYVIHTACTGGRRNQPDTQEIFDANFNMFENLLNNQDHYKYLINIGSGAEKLDTWYGKSKKIIAHIIKEHKNMISLRCYGVWGKYEKPDRFPSYCLTNDEVIIQEDRLFRYIHVDDLVKIIDGLIQHWHKKHYVLGEPILLSEFAKILNPDISVIIKGKGKDYV